MATPTLKTEELGFVRDSTRIKAYAAWQRREERMPAVVVIHDVRGLSDHYRDIARRFASEGFFALAVDLYSREGAPLLPNPEAAFVWMRQLNDRRVLADIDGAVRFLTSRPEVRVRSIGMTGFCMGGQYALMAACSAANIAACVSFYGMLRYAEKTEIKPQDPLDLAPQLTCPYLGLFGEDDALIPRADIKELEGNLRRAGKTFQTKIYPGAGHAFFNDQRTEMYRPEAAKDAWARTITFFRTHLGPS
jgi:carboxymethylenebutenolidase